MFRAPPPATAVLNSKIYLRRARKVVSATLANPQHKARITAETLRLNAEDLASVGIRMRRINRYARDSDGTARHWSRAAAR